MINPKSIPWSLLAFLNLVSLVLGIGTASVYNNCAFDAYYSATINETVVMQLLGPSGFQMPYDLNPQNVGVSIKLATSSLSEYGGPISQFEFTWSGDAIYWDFSNINGDGSNSTSYPFYLGGVLLLPSMENDDAYPTCETVQCPAGAPVCSSAYNTPNDPKTMVCDQNSDLTLTLCPAANKQVRQPVQRLKYPESHQHRGLPYKVKTFM